MRNKLSLLSLSVHLASFLPNYLSVPGHKGFSLTLPKSVYFQQFFSFPVISSTDKK